MAIKMDHGDTDLPENYEINVTPFIDVMLVLLIIFMIAAPLSTVDVPLDLPVSTAEPQPQTSEPIILSLQANLALSLGEKPVTREGLAIALDNQTKGDKQARIFLRSDKTVAYGDLMSVMDELRNAGYLKVALVGLEAGAAAGGGN